MLADGIVMMSSLVQQQRQHSSGSQDNQKLPTDEEQGCYSIKLAADSSSQSSISGESHKATSNDQHQQQQQPQQQQHEANFDSDTNSYVYLAKAFERDNNNSMLQLQHHPPPYHHNNQQHDQRRQQQPQSYNHNHADSTIQPRLGANQNTYRSDNHCNTTSELQPNGIGLVEQRQSRLCSSFSYSSNSLSEPSHLSPANQASLYLSGPNGDDSPPADLNQHLNHNHNHNQHHHNHHHHHEADHHANQQQQQQQHHLQQHYLGGSAAAASAGAGADGCCEQAQYTSIVDTCYEQQYISDSFYEQQLQLSSYTDLLESQLAPTPNLQLNQVHQQQQQQHSPTNSSSNNNSSNSNNNNNNYQGSEYVAALSNGANHLHELAIQSQQPNQNHLNHNHQHHQNHHQQHQHQHQLHHHHHHHHQEQVQISTYHSNQHHEQFSGQLTSHNYLQQQQHIGEACNAQQSVVAQHQQQPKQQPPPTPECNQQSVSGNNNNNTGGDNYGPIVGVEDGLGYTSLQRLSSSCENYPSSEHQVSTTSVSISSFKSSNLVTSIDNKLLSSMKGRRGRPRKKGSRSKNKVNGKLWEFIRDLLLNERTNPSFIRWERREDGVFKFVQSDKVAKMWGERKQNPKMTYEKLSRAMRYYYKSKVLLPVFGRRLVYKFGPNATGWLPETGDSALSSSAGHSH